MGELETDVTRGVLAEFLGRRPALGERISTAERDVIEAARAWAVAWEATMENPAGPGMRREVLALLAAVDALPGQQDNETPPGGAGWRRLLS